MDRNTDFPRKRIYLDSHLQIIFGVTLIAVMGVGSIVPTFPMIIREIGVSSTDIGMLITVFALPGILLSPLVGFLADQYGRKKILVPSLMIFGVAGGTCAFVPDFRLLLVLRFFQGIGAASLASLNITMIGDFYSGRERVAAMGYNASVLSIGTAGYPALGGILATFGWHYPYALPWLAIPLGIVVIFQFQDSGPKVPQGMKTYIANALKALGNRQVIGIFFASIMTFILLYGSFLTCFPLLMADAFGASPLIIGLFMACMPLATAVTSSQLDTLVSIFSERTLLKAAFLLYGIALVIIPLTPSLWLFLIPIIVFGIGHGTNWPCIYSLLTALAPVEYRATFLSVNAMIFRLGQTLGPLFMGVVIGTWGITGTFYMGALLSVAVSVLAVILIREGT